MNRKPKPMQGQLLTAIEWSSWALVAFGVFVALGLPVETAPRLVLYILLPAIAAYLLFFFHWLYPRFSDRPWVNYVPPVMNIAMVGAADYLIGNVMNVEVIFIVIIVNTAIRMGRRVALVVGLLCAVVIASIQLSRPVAYDVGTWVSTGLVIVVYFVAAYLAGSQTDIIRRQAKDADARNRNLRLLLDASAAGSSSLQLNDTLPLLAEKIAKGLPVTLCRLCLLDRTRQTLIDMGVYPLRAIADSARQPGQEWQLEDLPSHRRALQTGKPLVLHQSDPGEAIGQVERVATLFDDIKSACLIPLVFEGEALGIISLGEARAPDREPFDQGKLDLLGAIAAQTASLINNAQLHQAVQRNAERVAVLNQVGQAISSTIEMDGLLELIRQQLNRLIATDTYYVGLHEPGSNSIDLKIIFDEGKIFPPEKITYGAGLASRVIERREPVLLRRVSVESVKYAAPPLVVGAPRISESWLGVPLLMTDGFTGVLAVASYQPDVFDEDDMALLSNVAGQVALALDNARHHAQVEEQARLDSLTGAFNHGYTLKRLNEELDRAKGAAEPVSLIMLDIDYFKKYNDTYGHVMGDQVLRSIVQAIRGHLKQSDAVGRWGGEEFAIVLPNASTDQALAVADRIRSTLAALPVGDPQFLSSSRQTRGASLPDPRSDLMTRAAIPPVNGASKLTVSQGIATFPQHAAAAEELVDRSDQALYQAKARGRDQTQVALIADQATLTQNSR